MRIIDYIHQGGTIMYILLFLNIIGLAVMITKFLILSKEKRSANQTADRLTGKIKKNDNTTDPNILIELSKQEISTHMTTLEKGINTVKIIASISPLLGLLGTVIGVLIAFRVMSISGLTDPSSFAEGISMALITTVGGLIVAIPHYIGHSYLLGMLDDIEKNLENNVISKIV